MCGICGKVTLLGVEDKDIQIMMDHLVHRGPDEQGSYVRGVVGLGHRRLSIIDLSTGRQPVANEDGTIQVVLNGEIYNYRELREELLALGHRFSTRTDTEVIAHLYEEFGTNCVARLRGMFAFALWDEKRQRLFAARDHLGQKPFFYVERGTELVFASELKALLAEDPALAEVDYAALDQYLTLRIIAPPKTMFRSVRKLPPAHTLCFDLRSGLRVERYWDLEYEPKLSGSEEDLTDELESRLIECLKLHMVSDVPVGAFLSGGIDSTLVAGLLMTHVSSAPIKTFSVGLPFKDFDEAPYARMVAERYGTQHYEETMVPSLVHTLPRLVWHLDEPSDPLSLCTYVISETARKHVKVVLGGDGGDELFGGYDRYYGNLYAGYYARVPQSIRTYVIGPLLNGMSDGSWYKSRSHQLKWLHRLSFLQGGARYARSLGYFYFESPQKPDLYGPTMRGATRFEDPEAGIREAFERAHAVHSLDRMLYADSRIRLPDHSVMILDRMSMAHGLEARSPLMDHKIAEFAARLPTHLKVRGRTRRYLQTRLAERYVPKPLLQRPKQGFSSALPYMLKDEYRMLYKLFLRNSHLAREAILKQPGVNVLLDEHMLGTADHGNRLWLLLNAEIWYRMFIEKNSAEGLSREIAEAAGLPCGGENTSLRTV